MVLTKILEWLFVGSEWDANLQTLDELGITFLLNVKGGSYIRRPNFRHMIKPISDFGDTDLDTVLPECFAFIEEARASGASVAVHCAGGFNRAPTVAIAYLMVVMHMNLATAYRHVSGLRPSCCPHEDYFVQLQKLDQKLFGRVSFTEDDRGGSLQAAFRKAFFTVTEKKQP